MYSTWYLPPSKDSELPMRMRTFLSFKAKGGKGGRFWQIGLKPRCGVVTWTSHWFLMLCLSFLTSPSTIFPWGMEVSVESETRLPGPEFQPLCWLTQALHFSAQSSRSPRAVAQSLERNPEAPRLSTEASGCSFYLQHTTHFPFKSCESHRKLSLCVLVLALSNFMPVLLCIPGWLHLEAILLLCPECWVTAVYPGIHAVALPCSDWQLKGLSVHTLEKHFYHVLALV